MYSGQKYLVCMTDVPRRPRGRQKHNSQASGGLPHSEIRGSKGALPSPRLIAECHVLHRLLSPRHSPNALFALDPIQKTPDRAPDRRRSEDRKPSDTRIRAPRTSVGQSPFSTNDDRPRSVHRLGKTAFARFASPRPRRVTPSAPRGPQEPDRPSRGTIRKSVSCFSLFTMSKTIKVQTNSPQSPPRNTRRVCARRPQAGNTTTPATRQKTRKRGFWWVWEDSNLRPYAYQAYALTT